jgi:hypothetical protein
VAPVRHGLGGEQISPDAQAVQTPPPQTASAPQLVPSVTRTPVSLHTGPASQDSVPTWHGLVEGVHADPAAHATHPPSSQTRPLPQVVPSATFPLSAQTGNPVLQVMTALRHGSDD